MEELENKKRNYGSIFKEKEKRNHRKSNETKRKRTENNVQRLNGSCVGDPLGNAFPLSLAVLKEIEDVALSLFRRGGPYITQLLEGNSFTNAARNRITTNLKSAKLETMFTLSCTLKSTL